MTKLGNRQQSTENKPQSIVPACLPAAAVAAKLRFRRQPPGASAAPTAM